MSGPARPLRLECRRGLYCCVTQGLVQCFQVTGQYGMKASSGSEHPFTKKWGLHKVFPATNWTGWWGGI